MKSLAQTNCTDLVSVDIGVVREFAQQYQNNYLPYVPLKIMFKVENWVQYWPLGTPR